jgi:hypothetical protein
VRYPVADHPVEHGQRQWSGSQHRVVESADVEALAEALFGG